MPDEPPVTMSSLPDGFAALVVGASGGLGGAAVERLRACPRCAVVATLDRSSDPAFDLTDETSVRLAAERLGSEHEQLALIFVATGVLSVGGAAPEKAIARIEPSAMAEALAVNAIGPALLFKHLSPLLPATGRSLFAALSARVGSIGDNRLGGWISYRASKAALNQIVRTAAIEIARKRPEAVCAVLHPGTIETRLSAPFARGRFSHSPDESAARLLAVLDRLGPAQSGGFFDYDGKEVPW